jgi:hypothetical protein
MLKPVANKLSHFKCLVFVLLTLSGQQPLFADFNNKLFIFQSIPFLSQQKERTVTMSQQQVQNYISFIF